MKFHTDDLSFEEARVTVKYAPVRPAHEAMVLSGFDEFGARGMVFETEFADGNFRVSIDPEIEAEDGPILEAVNATLNEVYGAVGLAKAEVSLVWM